MLKIGCHIHVALIQSMADSITENAHSRQPNYDLTLHDNMNDNHNRGSLPRICMNSLYHLTLPKQKLFMIQNFSQCLSQGTSKEILLAT